jgi:hypothetical protein
MNKQNKGIEAIVGHLVDLYDVAAFTFTVPHSYTKFRAIKAAQRNFKAKCFIETGTYLGVTTRRCAPHFEQVYTIELDPDLAQKAKEFLAPCKNVSVLEGDAVKILPEVLEREIKDVLIFLDGHFSGGVTACGDLPEPAIEELKIISRYKEKIAGILIDDFRLFGTEAGFPSKSALFGAVEELFPDFTIVVYLDQIHIGRKAA